MKPIKIKVNLSKLDKDGFYISKSGDKWLELVAWPVKESKYGETHTVKQSLPQKHERAKTAPFVGNMTIPPTEDDGYRPASTPRPAQTDDIPF